MMIEKGQEIETADRSISSHRNVITGAMIGVSIAFITTVLAAKLPITATLLVALICFAIGLPSMAVGYVLLPVLLALSPVFLALFGMFEAWPKVRMALDKTFTLLQSVGQTIAAVGVIAIFWYISPVMGIVTIGVIVLPLLILTLLFFIWRPKAKKAVKAEIHSSEE